MKNAVKKAGWLVGGALLLSGGAFTASVVASSEAVNAQLEGWAKTVEALGGRVVVKSNEQTAFGGRQVTVLQFGQDVEVELTSSYRNGPWLPGGRFGASLVSTDVTFSPKLQRVLDAGTNGKHVTLETLVSFGGRTTTSIDLPAASFEADGMRVSWSASRGTLRSSGPRSSSELTLDRVSLEDEDVAFSLENVRFSNDAREVGAGLSFGSSAFSVARATVKAEGESVGVRDFTLKSSVDGDDGKVNVSAETAIGEIDGPEMDVRNVRLAGSLRSLDRVGLVTLVRAASDFAGTLAEDDPVVTRNLSSAVSRLLNGGPVLSLDEVSFSMPQGSVRLSANVAFTSGAKLDLERLVDDPSALLERLTAGARFEADEAVLRALEAEVGEEGAVSSIVDAGLLIRENGKLRATVEVDAKGVRVNGEALPPEFFRENDDAPTSSDDEDLATTCAKDLFLAQELYRRTHESYASKAEDLEFDEACEGTVEVVIDAANANGWAGGVRARSGGSVVRVSNEGLGE
ncbi:DUF945 family protein [Deinococcus yavapaiensis]|uniref:Uncharacterized protein YdgA (DUF945 family) n=1 Tax=Deinococcus yavapaiensis KR-236 TaxID=694435 RepID=A0A318SA93_9DEIO|nr:DUF945 family protein [Deinococcus yavapaiensis]PYE55308.1 uncharacterized protein YdgA (DUF945 family) [Deinococcus yavapaiensis KR-236]